MCNLISIDSKQHFLEGIMLTNEIMQIRRVLKNF